MSNLDRKRHYFVISLLLTVLFSCNNQKESDKTIICKDYSTRSITKVIYQGVYQQINDTVINWIQHNIIYYGAFDLNKTLRIDSLLCFNIKGNKFISAKLTRHIDNNANSDGITFFYGVKIREKWFFFEGAYVVLPREMYQKDIHTPLSFAKLHEIAMKEVFSGYLVKKKTKKDMGWWKNIFAPEYNYSYEINENFFKGMENRNQSGRGFGSCFECQTFEDYVLYLVRKNWERK